MSIPKLVKIEKTCDSNPAQWSAWTITGEYVYVRYRWGVLRVDRAASEEEWEQLLDDCSVMCWRVGRDFDGEMTTAQMLAISGMEMA